MVQDRPGVLLPGTAAPATGIYSITHHGHRPEHRAFIHEGAPLRACRYCKLQVRYRLAEVVLPIEEDFDFIGTIFSAH